MGNVARLRDGTVIDLVITNRSECTQQQPHTSLPTPRVHPARTHAQLVAPYHTARLPRPLTPTRAPRAFPADRAFSAATQNGLLPKGEGVFGAFNLRAPSASSTGARAPASFVELRFTFMANGSNVPLVLPRTQLTFYDLGRGLGGLRECMQIRGTHASSTMSFVSDKTELTADEYNASGASGSFRAPIQDLLNIVPAGGSPVRFLYPSHGPVCYAPLLLHSPRDRGRQAAGPVHAHWRAAHPLGDLRFPQRRLLRRAPFALRRKRIHGGSRLSLWGLVERHASFLRLLLSLRGGGL